MLNLGHHYVSLLVVFTFLVAKKRHNLFFVHHWFAGPRGVWKENIDGYHFFWGSTISIHFFWVYLHCILDFWTFEDPLKTHSPPTRSMDSHPTNEVSRPPRWEVKHPKTKLFRPQHLAQQQSWENPHHQSGFSGWGAQKTSKPKSSGFLARQPDSNRANPTPNLRWMRSGLA